MAASLDKSVHLQRCQTRERAENRRRVGIVAAGDRGNVDGEIAHHAFDEVGAQPIIGGQGIALDGRKPAGADALRVAPGPTSFWT